MYAFEGDGANDTMSAREPVGNSWNESCDFGHFGGKNLFFAKKVHTKGIQHYTDSNIQLLLWNFIPLLHSQLCQG